MNLYTSYEYPFICRAIQIQGAAKNGDSKLEMWPKVHRNWNSDFRVKSFNFAELNDFYTISALNLFWCNTLYRASSHFTKSFQSSQNLRFRTVESTTMQRKFSKTVVGWACQRLIDIHQWYAGCKFFRDQHMTWRIIGFNHRDRRGFIADDLLRRLFWRIFLATYTDVIIYTRDEEAFATKVMEVLLED